MIKTKFVSLMNKISLIFGGAKSGKSNYAENLAIPYSNKIYIATAEARDEEMQKRIKNHQNQRDNNWHTIEEPVNFIPHLTKSYTENTIILIDCMTIWLSNLMEKSLSITDMTDTLLNNLSSCSADVILVSNELGLSIVPENALARAFRDEQGLLNQKLAKRATNVVFIAAGLPLILK